MAEKHIPKQAASPLQSPQREMTRALKRMVALFIAGLLMPFTLGMGVAAFTEFFVTTPQGMDSYWPAFLGAGLGAVIGLGLWVAAFGQMLKARSCKKMIVD